MVPIAIYGTASMLPPGSWVMDKAGVRIKVGTPFSTKGMTIDEARELAQRQVQCLRDELAARPSEPHSSRVGRRCAIVLGAFVYYLARGISNHCLT